MRPSKHLLLGFLVLAGIFERSRSCEIEEMRYRCKIQKNKCTCGVGCKSEYRYNSRAECSSVLEAKEQNICSVAPCLHNGTCIQVKNPGFKCKCESTGYYGTICEKECPKSGSGQRMPLECIVI